MKKSPLATDRDLLAAIVVADKQAFEVLYRRYHRPLFGYLARWLERPEVIEEVINEVMLAVWQGAGKFRGESRVSTWIFGIAYRQAMKACRYQTNALEHEVPQLTDHGADARHRDLRLVVGEALAELSADHRTVLELTYFQDCSQQEIADIVDCPVGTVKTRMFHARKQLRQLLPRFGWST